MRAGFAIALLVASGCLGTTPEQAERNALPPDHGEGEATHRPGQPCLLCHGFAVAGTVYEYADDSRGIGGVRVSVVDALDREFSTTTNRAGNFYFTSGDGDDDEGGRGSRLGFEPKFPLEITVDYQGTVQEMETFAWREGSCAGCHKSYVGTDSVGRIYVREGTR